MHGINMDRKCYQSLSDFDSGRARLSPPRRSGGITLPLMIVSRTIASTTCVVTRPYHTDDPCGVYI